MEQVVDAERRRLDVSVVHRELVRPEGRTNGKFVQPYVLILDLGGPICRKGPLDAGARHPASLGVGRAAGEPSGQIGDGVIVPDPGSATLSVKQPMIETRTGEAEASRQRCDPSRMRVGLE